MGQHMRLKMGAVKSKASAVPAATLWTNWAPLQQKSQLGELMDMAGAL
jgi:hypothetical protein